MRLFAASWLALVSAACSAAPDESRGPCSTGTVQPLIGGEPDPRSVGVPQATSSAIGAIESELGTHLCTGTLIAARWLLTAAHCSADGLQLQIALNDGSDMVTPLGKSFVHPEVDLGLIELAADGGGRTIDVQPLTWRREALETAVAPGDPVVLAGTGLNEHGQRGVLAFVREPVVALDERSIRVDGSGMSGACVGDSGGPLLALRDGRAEVIGVLSQGAASCRGLDEYVRVDAHARWIETTMSSPTACATTQP